jgi:t-SNARE complex subunit (syntaxin)
VISREGESLTLTKQAKKNRYVRKLFMQSIRGYRMADKEFYGDIMEEL